MAELAEGARLLSECTVKSRTEGSNPSLSASDNEKADVYKTSAFPFFSFLRPVTMQLLDRQLQISHYYTHIFTDSTSGLQIFSVNLV